MREKPSQSMHIEEKLVVLDMNSSDWNNAIKKLSNKLLEAGYVKPEFCNAVINREEKYPTGLATEIPVAIPHTDSKFCITPAIAIAILQKPVLFGSMGIGDDLFVEMIFLMSVTNPTMQSSWVRRLVEFFRTPGELQKLKNSNSKEEVVSLLKSHIFL